MVAMDRMDRHRAFQLQALAAITLVVGVFLALLQVIPVPSTRTAAVPRTAPAVGTAQFDVTYCIADGFELKMDVYSPPGKSATLMPALLYVHGGGWTEGSKSWVDRILSSAELMERGYVVAAIDYRLAPEYRWPAQIEDVKCAVRYLRANASTYGIDPDRIGVWGESAGGHLVSMLGLAGPDVGFEGTGGYPDVSSRVQAVIDMFGPTDFTVFDVEDPYYALMSWFLMGAKADKAMVERISPVTYASKDDPPFLIFHGDKDPLVSPSHSRTLYERLRAAGVPVDLVMVENAGHVFYPTGGPTSLSMPQIKEVAISFFDHTLGGAERLPDAGASRYFPETGRTVRGKFLDYWATHGGTEQFGYPISGEVTERSGADMQLYTMQYFERAVLEYHPGEPGGDVIASLLGSFRYKQIYRNGDPPQVPNTSPGSKYFPETGKRLGGPFLEYWQAHGGIAGQGYPISDELQEKNNLDGKLYTVQYFERAVFEFHPENPSPHNVLLSQLGTLKRQEKLCCKE